MTQPPLPVLDITYAYELEVGAFSLLRLVSGATEVSEEFTWCFFFFFDFLLKLAVPVLSHGSESESARMICPSQRRFAWAFDVWPLMHDAR